MAWRIEEQVVHGKIDNRAPGRVVGELWLAGRDEAVELELEGNPWRDLAGHVLKFSNPDAKVGDGRQIAAYQNGTVGDMTASRKVKVLDCTMDELMEFYKARQPFPWHWGNSLYLEWYSVTNGRVVIEAAHYQLELDAEPAWTMSDEDESTRQTVSAEAMTDFMERMAISGAAAKVDEDDDHPQSPEEAQADEEDARMQLLLDRVTARLERGELDIEDFDQVYEEERTRLMRERGEKDPVLTPEEVEKRRLWIEEMNSICEEALVDLEAEKWKGENSFEDERHPLVEECSDLGISLYHDVKNAGWAAEDAQDEHPLREIVNSVTSASAKLAGALGDDWPPDRLIAGNVIVRLKKARDYLRDALLGLDSAEEEALATPKWRHQTRLKVIEILAQTDTFLREAREVLEVEDDDLGIF
ncbi:MAG: hypothetical protein V4689_07365 [Verrucomicrobiota bacterium]